MTDYSIEARSPRQHTFVFLLGYAALLIYGSLYPLSGWRTPTASPVALFARSLEYWSRADMLTNLIIYIPFGLLLASWSLRYHSTAQLLLQTGIAGMLLSLSVETAQMFLPQRTPSLIDIALNTLGSCIGAALLPLISESTLTGRLLRTYRRHWIRPGVLATFGVLVIGLWASSQLYPFVPSLDADKLRSGLRPLWQTLHQPARFDIGLALSSALEIGGLGLLAFTMGARQRDYIYAGFAAVVILVLLLKVPIIGRHLTAEAVLGTAMALLLLRHVNTDDIPFLLRASAVVLALAYAAEQLRPDPGVSAVTHGFSWHLFEAQRLSRFGLADILATLWPFAALAYIALHEQPTRRLVLLFAGGMALLAFATGLEWMQQYIPGRRADITDIVVAMLGWTLPWLHPRLRHNNARISWID